jgi:hypothetical protein
VLKNNYNFWGLSLKTIEKGNDALFNKKLLFDSKTIKQRREHRQGENRGGGWWTAE